MLALLGVWLGLISLLLSLLMVIHRPAMTDVSILLVLYFGVPGSLCLSGLVLWAHRRDGESDSGPVARRVQAKAAIVLALAAAAIVYALIIGSHKINP